MLITTACMKLNVFSKFFNNTWSVMFILLHAEKKNSILLINSLQWVNRVSSTTLGTDSWPWFCSSVISSLQTFSRTVLTPICRLSSDITKEKVWQIISTLLFHNSDKLHTRKVTWVPENVYVFFSPEHERAFHVKGYCAHTGINWLWANRNWNEVTVHVEQVSPLCIFFHFDIILSFIKDLSCALPLSLMGRNVSKLLECFSNECHKTKTKVIRAANQRKGKYPEEPMRTRVNSITGQSKLMQFRITFNTRWKVTLRESAIYCLINIK